MQFSYVWDILAVDYPMVFWVKVSSLPSLDQVQASASARLADLFSLHSASPTLQSGKLIYQVTCTALTNLIVLNKRKNLLHLSFHLACKV